MAQLVDIQRFEVGPQKLTATVRIDDSGPLMTSDDLEGTTRIYNLLPHIIEHVCLGDSNETFRDVMGNTELAHLLEHMTVELLAQSGIAGKVSAGRTRAAGGDGRSFEIELACPDDVLVAGALASASWMMGWAYGGGGDPEPDVDATVSGLVGLVESLPTPAARLSVEQGGTASERAALQVVDGGAASELEQGAGDGKRLTVDDDPASAEVTNVSRSSEPRTAELAVERSPRPPRESPEARQASADGFAAGVDSQTARAAGVRRTAAVTDAMPESKSVR